MPRLHCGYRSENVETNKCLEASKRTSFIQPHLAFAGYIEIIWEITHFRYFKFEPNYSLFYEDSGRTFISKCPKRRIIQQPPTKRIQ